MLLGRPSLVKGFMQLYSVEQKRSQALEAHAAAFSTIKVRPRSCLSGTQAVVAAALYSHSCSSSSSSMILAAALDVELEQAAQASTVG